MRVLQVGDRHYCFCVYFVIVFTVTCVYLQLYSAYLENQEEIVNELEFTLSRSREFEDVYRNFEGEKQCYLPLNTFLLKPAQRLLHYKLILERKSPLHP